MKQDETQQLAALKSDVLRTPEQHRWTVASLEHALLQEFPARDAEAWDHTGLMVGIRRRRDRRGHRARSHRRCGSLRP